MKAVCVSLRGAHFSVGTLGGKNFHLIHPSADINNVVQQSVRAAFEYQGGYSIVMKPVV
jgi:acyl-CoA reductase-like NAD-dependent aldehyde dehydrogenase